MPITHLLLAILVAVIWGINFLFIKLGLEEVSPLFLCALRFTFASIPLIFFIRPPNAPFKMVVLYGLVMFALQFALMFLGMYLGMTPGLASLVMQMQVFFSMFFATMIMKEMPYTWQIIGALISFSGIGVVATHTSGNISALGFICILASAATWGVGNLITKKVNTNNMLSLVIWGSFVAAFPMYILSFIFEGPHLMMHEIQHIGWKTITAISYIVYISTWIGYVAWSWLLNRYRISTVVPFTLLVPIVALICSVIFMGEAFHPWKLYASLLVISGLGINLLGNRMFLKPSSPTLLPFAKNALGEGRE